MWIKKEERGGGVEREKGDACEERKRKGVERARGVEVMLTENCTPSLSVRSSHRLLSAVAVCGGLRPCCSSASL